MRWLLPPNHCLRSAPGRWACRYRRHSRKRSSRRLLPPSRHKLLPPWRGFRCRQPAPCSRRACRLQSRLSRWLSRHGLSICRYRRAVPPNLPPSRLCREFCRAGKMLLRPRERLARMPPFVRRHLRRGRLFRDRLANPSRRRRLLPPHLLPCPLPRHVSLLSHDARTRQRLSVRGRRRRPARFRSRR